MINPESKPPVTIEDLLRLKRAERPPSEFWAEFDRELRAKQLAALVEKRPWWRQMPRVFSGVARYHLPLGATAVLAITLLSIRDYHPVLPTTSGEAAANTQVVSTESAVADNSTTTTETAEESVPAAVNEPTVTASTVSLRSEATVPGQLARMIPMLETGNPATNHTEVSPSARSMAENLVVAEAMLGTPSSSFEARVIPTRPAPREPLAQMTSPSESRRSRFAAAFASMAAETSIAPSARVAQRLSDEQLYDSIHRFGASGNSVSFRF